MKISVIVPAYNEEKYIKNCLDSLIKQSEKPDEIIVVNNNSTDNTVSIVKTFKGVRIIHENNQGITYARNAGFNASTCKILARCDADGIMPNDWIKKIKNDFIKNKKTVAISPSFLIFDVLFINKSLFLSNIFYFFSKLLIKAPALIGPSMAITKNVWKKVKNEVCFDNDGIFEDIDLGIHISKYGQIYLDRSIIVKISGRRIKYNPFSFFIKYPLILIKTIISHRHLI